MEKITKETGVSLGLVVTLVGAVFTLGKHSQRLDDVIDSVHAVKIENGVRVESDKTFREEVLQRLARIEQAVKTKRKGD